MIRLRPSSHNRRCLNVSTLILFQRFHLVSEFLEREIKSDEAYCHGASARLQHQLQSGLKGRTRLQVAALPANDRS